MTTPLPDPIAQQILTTENRRAHAREILGRSSSPLPVLLLGPLITLAIANYFDGRALSGVVFNVLISLGPIALLGLAWESWSIRRRLEAAITLLELQQATRD